MARFKSLFQDNGAIDSAIIRECTDLVADERKATSVYRQVHQLVKKSGRRVDMPKLRKIINRFIEALNKVIIELGFVPNLNNYKPQQLLE